MLLPRFLRFRYSLRALFVFITLFALWGGYHANRGWQRRHAVSVLRQNGNIELRPQLDRSMERMPEVVGTLYSHLVDYLWGDDAIETALIESDLNPKAVKALGHLPPVRILALTPYGRPLSGGRGPFVSEATQVALRHHRVRQLVLTDYAMTTDDCNIIAGQPCLEVLSLKNVRLPTAGLAAIASARKLRSLELADCTVDGDLPNGLIITSSIEEMALTRLSGSTDSAHVVAACARMRNLVATGPTVDDNFLAVLENHQLLSELTVGGRVGDLCLRSVARMPSLRRVALQGGRFTEAAVAGLRDSRPDVQVEAWE